MKGIIATFCLMIFSAVLLAQNYKPVDDRSKVHFAIKNFGIATGGDFKGLSGSISFNPEDPSTASFDVSVDASTVDTDIEQRDNHLRKAEYFDVKTYPTISFKSTKVTKTNKNGFLYMFGNITIKGVTREIKFPFKATAQPDGYLFEGNFNLNRREFGVGGKSLSMADDLTVSLTVFAKSN